jgi:hypothetical protein
MLRRDTSQPLTMVLLQTSPSPGRWLILLFKSSSSITKLHFSVAINYTNFFEALTSSLFTHQLLPKLEILHCDIQSFEDADALLESLVSFLWPRCCDGLNSQTSWPTAWLQCLTLTFLYTIDTDTGGFKDQVSHILAPFTDHSLSLVLGNFAASSLRLLVLAIFESHFSTLALDFLWWRVDDKSLYCT